MIRRLAATILLVSIGCVTALAQQAPLTDVKDRRRAPKTLARQGSAGIPALTPLLQDPDLEVRVETVKALVEIGTQHSLEPLTQAIRDNDPEVQIRATDGLVNFYLPGYARTGLSGSLRRAGGRLVSHFTETNDQVIDPYVETRPEVVQALTWLVAHGASMESRANAARAVGILRGRAAVPELLEAARSKDTQLIYESLVAIQKIGDHSAGPRLEFLLRDLDERVQVTAVETAGLLRNTSALPALMEVLKRTENKKVRRAALTSIAMMPDPSTHALLSTYLGDRDSDLRAAAAEGLGRLKSPDDLPALRKGYDTEDSALARLSMAFALVTHGNIEVSELSPFQFLVNNLNSAARLHAAKALLIEAARDPQVRGLLVAAIPRGTRDEKIGLAEVLAASGDASAEAAIEALTRDANVDVASAAVRSLRVLRARTR
jgi:HEAT repeat protein